MLLPLFLLFTGFGLMYVVELLARRRQVEEVIRFVRYLRREIRCSGRPLVDLLDSYESDLPILVHMDCAEPFDLLSCYKKAKKESFKEMFFDPSDWRALDTLFETLGNGDSLAQEESLKICEESFGHSSVALREKVVRNGKPALVLGASAGAVLVLLLS